MTKTYFKNELKYSKRFDHVSSPSFSHEKNSLVEYYFPQNFLCRVMKG